MSRKDLTIASIDLRSCAAWMAFLLTAIAFATAAFWFRFTSNGISSPSQIIDRVVIALSEASEVSIFLFLPLAFFSTAFAGIVWRSREGERDRRMGTAAAAYILLYAIIYWLNGVNIDFRQHPGVGNWESTLRHLLPVIWPFSIPFLLARREVKSSSKNHLGALQISNRAILILGALSYAFFLILARHAHCS